MSDGPKFQAMTGCIGSPMEARYMSDPRPAVIAKFDNCSYCNGTGKVDVEDDGFVTVGYNHERTVRDQLQREVYGHERLINRLHEALMRDDYDSIDGLIRDAYLSLHGPRE